MSSHSMFSAGRGTHLKIAGVAVLASLLFVALMSAHHQGAIAMADDAMRQAGDVRLKVMSHGIRHGQQGEINLMRGLAGNAAVRAASRALFATDAAPADNPGTMPLQHHQ